MREAWQRSRSDVDAMKDDGGVLADRPPATPETPITPEEVGGMQSAGCDGGATRYPWLARQFERMAPVKL